MANKSEFDTWFKEQHGKRPSIAPISMLLTDVDTARNEFLNAQHLLNGCAQYDAQYNSALYAWQAAPERRK